MNPRSTAWLIYSAFLIYWWVAAAMTYLRSRDPEWRPFALDRFERAGVHLSTRGYVRLIYLSTVLITLSASWLPRLWISILESPR